MATNPKTDAYIENTADFAKPILTHLRKIVHKACPQVVETFKWNSPTFEYKGLLCSIASFKSYCSFGFWKASLMKDAATLVGEKGIGAAGNLGKLTTLKDLPSDKVLVEWIKEAMRLNDENIKLPKDKPRKYDKIEVSVPEYFTAALKKQKVAAKVFEAFSYSHRKEYIEWITEAKTEATREKRVQQALEWIAEGKGRNWKYQKQ
ncbi:MAG: YdeI/OmpD-associated family protein [Gemmatimonadaceae bacterium]|nr:YdeI/OmpD-associated family protein [Chitinophagaceae bacterium]